MNHADELLQVVERGHRNMDAFNYPPRAHRPAPLVNTTATPKRTPNAEEDPLDLARMAQHRAKRTQLKEATVSVVSDLFDPDPAEHGTLKGARAHRVAGDDLCFSCKRAASLAARGIHPEDVPRPNDSRYKAQQTAKALSAHREARKALQASLTAEERARLTA
jgi:hypothetical protein